MHNIGKILSGIDTNQDLYQLISFIWAKAKMNEPFNAQFILQLVEGFLKKHAKDKEITQLTEHKHFTAKLLLEFAIKAGIKVGSVDGDSAAYWGARMLAEIMKLKEQIIKLVCDISGLETENHNLKCDLQQLQLKYGGVNNCK